MFLFKWIHLHKDRAYADYENMHDHIERDVTDKLTVQAHCCAFQSLDRWLLSTFGKASAPGVTRLCDGAHR